MDILKKINEDLVTSMKSRADELIISTLRMMKSSIKNAEIAKRGKGELTEEDILGVLSTMVKQRKESVEQYQKRQTGMTLLIKKIKRLRLSRNISLNSFLLKMLM